MTTTADLKSRASELKARFRQLDEDNSAIVSSAPTEDNVIKIDNARRESFTKNQNEMHEIKSTLELLEGQISLKEYGQAPASGMPAWMADTASEGLEALEAKQAEGKSFSPQTLGRAFTASPEFKRLQESGTARMDTPFVYRGADIGSKWDPERWEKKDVYSFAPVGGPPLGFKPLVREDIVVQAFRKVRVRDLFPVQTTTAAVIEYFRAYNFVANNSASVTPERLADNSNFGLAPHTSLTFQGTQSQVRLINHWEAAHRNVLNDVPQLQGVIDTELLYGLRLQEDYQLLNGTGTGEDLLGLMNQPYIQNYVALNGGAYPSRSAGSGQGGSYPNWTGTASAGAQTTDSKADDVRRAATKAILAYYEPTGVIMHPSDWEAIETTKDSTGAYVIAIAVAMGAQQRVWRLPVVDTPAMNQGSALVGSFGLGAKLYDREEGTIRIAEQHMDFFLRSAIVVLAEERIALTCPRPESFVKVTLGA